MDSQPTCHEFEPCNAEDPPCSGLNKRLFFNKLPSVGVVWKLGEGYPLRNHHRHLTVVQNVEVRRQKP
ncbi:hypothetical protein TNCV_2827381 [Trichonephila clavipes]|nr:hypothetical protein TNCV_2827381 [Trichonephila clavipes]